MLIIHFSFPITIVKVFFSPVAGLRLDVTCGPDAFGLSPSTSAFWEQSQPSQCDTINARVGVQNILVFNISLIFVVL